MTFAAGLGVIERPKPIVYAFRLVESRLIGLMGGIVHYSITLVVESGWRFGIRGAGKSESNTQKRYGRQELHDSYLAGEGRTR